MSRII